MLQARHIKARLAWARELSKWKMVHWQRVLFSDELKFNLIGSDGLEYCWRRPGKVLDPKNTTKRVKHGEGHVMVWGFSALQS